MTPASVVEIGYDRSVASLTPDALEARSAGLRYVDDRSPGITRKRIRTGFAFFDVAGKRITDDAEVARIKSLAIPPAYERVWICPIASGHIQATARDARGRKQYRYHKRWREVRDASKFESTIDFARALPQLRARVARDIERDCMDRDKVIATVVRMLDDTLIRVGNETYARDNKSYGLTTLRPRHVAVSGDKKRIRLTFRGKSGVEHAIEIEDKRLAKTVARCRDLPGELLFTYLDEDDVPRPARSEDVNEYLRETLDGDFSAKDFRTFAATVICAIELERAGEAATVAEAKSKIARALEITAKRLGNTPAVCRKSYVHPAVLEAYLDERRLVLPRPRPSAATRGLDTNERRMLAYLVARGKRDASRERVALLKRSVSAATRAASV